ncbi:MAG: MFS transporter [Candidatus Methanomethylophilaceae archaeon]|nr:MFS transporter [Candidatus Methanomethylophilaceae archaeon]
MYDVANSAFILLACSVLPIYFYDLAMEAGHSSADYLAYWSIATAVSTLVMFVVGPLVGSLSDRKGWRRPIFMGTVVTGVLLCVALGLPKWWVTFLVIYILVKIAYNASLVVSDGMLNDITTPERMDEVSSRAYAMGYIGSCIPFIACLVLVVFSDMMDPEGYVMSFQTAVMLGLIITAGWWLMMSLPLFRDYRQICYNTIEGKGVWGRLSTFLDTLKEMSKIPAMMTFLISFFFYIDGVYTVMELSTSYGEALGLGSVGLLGALLVSQIVAFPSTLFMSRMSNRYGAHRVIYVCIAGYMGIAAFSLVLDSIVQFFILAICVGLFQGAIQALSRAYFARMVPKDKTGEFFGIMDVFGKGATIVGTVSVAAATMFSGEIRCVGLILLAMFTIGLLFFVRSTRVKVYDADHTV